MKKFKIIHALLFAMSAALILVCPPSYASDEPRPEHLSQAMECEFTTDLMALAEKLDYNPVKIYNWVYENIEFEDYGKSRKGAQITYFTMQGNEWDQCSLLITLLRISGVPARYVQIGEYNRVYVETWIPAGNYRGQGNGETREWVPLVPWLKHYRIQEGIDLFPEGIIPPELNFDFDDYVSSVKQKTALEMFEEQVQDYLNVHYPGKSLKDVPYQDHIVKNPGSILPSSFPLELYTYGDLRAFAEIPDSSREYVILCFKKYSDETLLLEKKIYLPEIAGKRFCLDFTPASSGDAQVIADYGGMCQTPDGLAQVKPVLRIDGEIIGQGSPIYTGERFFPAYEKSDGSLTERPPKQAGTFMQMAFDGLSASEKTIEKMKIELKNVASSKTYHDDTREEYLGRYGQILITTFLAKTYEAIKRTDELLYCKRDFSTGIYPTFIYTFPSEIKSGPESKYLIHPAWNIDAGCSSGRIYKATGVEYFDWAHPFNEFASNLYMYGASYNEGLMFEDWQDTPGLNTIRAVMVANEQGILVITLTIDDIQDGHLYVLEDQTDNRYSDHTIQFVIDELRAGQAVTMPVRKVEYEGMIGSVQFSFGPRYRAYFFSMDHGGGSTDDSTPVTTVESLAVSETDNAFTSDVGTLEVFSDNIIGCAVEAVGDPVDMVTGEFYQDEKPDIFIRSRGYNLEIKREYKSQLAYDGPFGYGWTWNHMERILLALDGSLIYFDLEGKAYHLTPNGDGTYQYPPGTTFTLEKQGSIYVLTQKDKKKIFFSEEGYLTKKEDLYGNVLTFEYNEQNQLSALKDSLNRTLYFTYDANGKVTSVRDFTGRSCEYAYDGDDLISFTDLEGNTTRYEHLKNQENPANDHNMSKYILPNGDFLEIGYYKNDQVAYHTNKKAETFNFQYSRLNKYAETWNEAGYYRKVFYNDSHDVIRVTTSEKTIEVMEYDENHNKISHTDANGNTTTFTYDANRNMTSKTNALGEKWLYEYDLRFNKPKTVMDPKRRVTTYEYDANGNLTTQTDALGNVTTYAYDAYGNNTCVTDAPGNTTEKTYDAFGLNLVQQKDKNGNITSYAYDNVGNMVSMTDPAEHQTQHEYNNYNQKTCVTGALGNQTTYEYDVNRKLTKKIEPNGAVTENIYDTARDIMAGAKIVQTIDPLGNSEYFDYDKLGNLISKKDRHGNVTKYAYDELNRVIEETDPFQNSIKYAYDGNGNLVKKTDNRGNETLYTYDEANRKTSMTDPGGNTTTYEYDINGNLVRETNVLGVKTAYQYDATNRLVVKIIGEGLPDARIYLYEYDALGRLKKSIDPLGGYVEYEYNPNGKKTKEASCDSSASKLREISYVYDSRDLIIKRIDPNGNEYALEYDAAGRKTAEIDPPGNRVNYVYDGAGDVTEVADQLGHTIVHTYNLRSERVMTTNALGHTKIYSYDNNGNQVSVTDEDGNTTKTYYDSLNRKIGVEDALASTTLLNYDENSNLVSRVDPLGNVFRFEYDRNNRLVKEIDALGNETTHEYDALGRRTTTTDAKGAQTLFSYNRFNEQTQITDALNQVVTRDYDALGRLVSTVDARNIETLMAYDALGRLTRLTQAAGTLEQAVTQYEYDANGNKTRETNAMGVVTAFQYDARNLLVKKIEGNWLAEPLIYQYQYDARGQITKTTDPRGNATQFTYDAIGRQAAVTDAGENTTTYSYDRRGNVILEATPEGEQAFHEYDALARRTKTIIDGTEQSFFYDANSRLIKKINGNAIAETYEYDALGLVVTKTKAQGTLDESITRYTYDVNSNLGSITNAENATVSYEYDALNRRTMEIDADGTVKGVAYDGNANMVQETRRDATIIARVYDNLNRQTEVDMNGQVVQTFEYDILSRMTRAVDHNEGRRTHTVDYEYDVFNRVTAEVQDGTRIEKAFDANSNPTSITYPSGKIVQRTYNAVNLLTTISDQAANIAAFAYDKSNRLTTTTLGNGIELNLGYNKKGLETARTYANNGSTTYAMDTAYDSQGNVVQETITQNNEELIKTYSYDNLDRLITEQIETLKAIWLYDRVGNWVFTNQNGQNESRAVNQDNEYTIVGSRTPTYDANGNMTSDGKKEYFYDWANRLIEVRDCGQTIIQYTYDALNRRVSEFKIQNSKFKILIYDESQVIEEYVDGQFERAYAYGAYIDDPIMTECMGQRFYYVKDRQYSVTAITDDWGDIVERYEYSAFGLMNIFNELGDDITENGSTIGNTYGYTGRRWDAETGLWYYRNRMYSPTLGRFLQRDPAGYVDGMNLYAYVKNNPLKYLDAMGLMTQQQAQQQESAFWNVVSGIGKAVGGAVDAFTQDDKIYSGVERAVTGLTEAVLNEELQKGTLFGFAAAGRTTVMVVEYTLKDAGGAAASAIAGKYLLGYKQISEGAQFAIGRGLTWRRIPIDVAEYGKAAREVSQDIQRIRQWIYSK